MKNLTNAKSIKVKGILFLFLGSLSTALLLLEHPSLQVGALLTVAV